VLPLHRTDGLVAERSVAEKERLMTTVLVHRLRGHHALLEMALEEERSRAMPDDRRLAGIKKKKLAIKDRLTAFVGASAPSAAH